MKPSAPKSSAQERIRDLTARLEDAEQTLDAIRSGKVDALVVDGPEGPRVFTLQGADHRYRRLVEGMKEGAAIISPDGLILYANASFAELVHTPLDRVLGSALGQYVPAVAYEEIRKLLLDAQRETTAVHTTLVTDADREIPVHISAVAASEMDGAVSLIVTDLSEPLREAEAMKKRLSAQLADKTRLLEAVLRHMPSALVAVDRDGIVTVVNQRAEELWGQSAELDSGRLSLAASRWDDFDFALGDHALSPKELPLVKSLRFGEECRGLELLMKRPDGVELCVSVSTSPLRDDAGRIDGAVSVFDDITERKRLHQDLIAERAAFSLLARASVTLSSLVEFDETLERVATLAVPQIADFCAIYLREDDGSIRQAALVHKDEKTRNDYRELARAIGGLSADLPFCYPLVFRTGETELVSYVTDEMVVAAARDKQHLASVKKLMLHSWIAVPLKSSDATIGVLMIARTTKDKHYDASDVPLAEEMGRRVSLAIDNARLYRDVKRAYEAERAARDKAELATRLKDEFLATLSHELRTPLNSILGWARMLQTGPLSAEKRVQAVDVIVRNAAAQNQLIDDLLDVSRIISGKLRLEVAPVDLNRLVLAALDVVRPAADAKGVRLILALEEAVAIDGDAGRLQQVFWNLLTNAVKFTPRGGTVKITLRRHRSAAEFTVSDTGAGIAPEFLPYVFDRFRQQDGSTTRSTGGLGLGLAIVRNLVELHGGLVEAKSDGATKGSTFTVQLPIAPVRSKSTVAATKPESDGTNASPALTGLKILVVDDEADGRDLLRTVLEQCDAAVTTAPSVADAMEAIRRIKPDVIVSDIGMPVEDGYSFLRRLRALSHESGGRTPAIALTAYARAEDRTRALVAGFQSFATKPVDPQELVTAIASLAGR